MSYDDSASKTEVINYLSKVFISPESKFIIKENRYDCYDIDLYYKNSKILIEIKQLFQKNFSDEQFMFEKTKFDCLLENIILDESIKYVFYIFLYNNFYYIFRLDIEYFFEKKVWKTGSFYCDYSKTVKCNKQYINLDIKYLKKLKR